jgi:hypothetical protein
MIAFGVAIGEPEPYRRYAEPGIRRVAEPDSEVMTFASVGPLARTYNLLLDAAAQHDDLEALVLLDPYVELSDAGFCDAVRHALRDPEVAVAGCAGARGANTIAWWEGDASAAPVVHRYEELGGGEVPGFAWTRPGPPGQEVDSVDGMLLALSPWAVQTVRFDERLRLNLGFDLDYCRQVREAGRKVMTADLRVIHHRPLELMPNVDVWVEAHIQVAEKWDGARPQDWERRARRAEAEHEAARAVSYSRLLQLDAREEKLERALAEATGTVGWRLTEPLRRLNRLRRELRR